MTNGPMRRDIERQPAVMAAFAAREPALVAIGAEALRSLAGGRVFVCGCGDGLFAAEAVQAYAESLGLDWRPIGALDLVLSAASLRPADRVLAISMSGNVDRTVEAAQAAVFKGITLIALVNGTGGRLAALAARTVSLDLPDVAPFLCGTASYTATIQALLALAAGAAGLSHGPVMAEIGAAQAAVLSRTDAVLDRVALPTGVRLLSAGPNRASVRYGAAKFVELTRLPAWSADLEEFAHSQYWAMPTTDLVVVVATDPALAAYADASCAALDDLGVTTLAIEGEASPVARATHRVAVPPCDPVLTALVTAIPLQLLAAALARAQGLDPDTRSHLKSDEARFRVSRQLTRRTMLGTGQ